MKIEIKFSIREIEKIDWHEMIKGIDIPFYYWDWLSNLEISKSVDTAAGWQPLYFIAWLDNEIIGIAPLFLKNHSYGEFIFDQSFARLAQDLNLNYYPKLIGMSPYSPVEGYQFIYKENSDKEKITKFLISKIEEFALKNNILSINFLYVNNEWGNYLKRLGYYDWINTRSEWIRDKEQSFNDFLLRFNSNQRRNINRERKSLINQKINIKTYTENSIDIEIMQKMYCFYENHCSKWGAWGSKYLSFDFFKKSLNNKKNILIFSAYKESNNNSLAMSMCIKNKEKLWGRYWGSSEEINNLHFELCYYQPIEWAIKNNIVYFDPGAGGQQKRRRGFYARATRSYHKWFDKNMEKLISDWLIQANLQTLYQIKLENESIPFNNIFKG